MSQQKNNIAGLTILLSGLVIGAASVLLIKELRPMHPSQVLKEVKNVFRHQGSVTGSWIDYDPLEYDAYDSKTLVYYGGISIQEGKDIITYRFIADAYTGEIIDTYEYRSA